MDACPWKIPGGEDQAKLVLEFPVAELLSLPSQLLLVFTHGVSIYTLSLWILQALTPQRQKFSTVSQKPSVCCWCAKVML